MDSVPASLVHARADVVSLGGRLGRIRRIKRCPEPRTQDTQGDPSRTLSPAPHEVDDQRNDCDDQQKVNECTCGMESKPTDLVPRAPPIPATVSLVPVDSARQPHRRVCNLLHQALAQAQLSVHPSQTERFIKVAAHDHHEICEVPERP
jgi:hypothetical protein